MATRVPPLHDRAILFAHRGARAHATENTLDAFRLGLRLGATGLESDVWLTADGVAVLDHDGVVGGSLRRRSIGSIDRTALPDHVPSLAELYEACGAAYELSLDIKDPAAFGAAMDVARRHDAVGRLWLCHDDLDVLSGWRELEGDVRLIHSTRLAAVGHGPEKHAAVLRERSIDGVNLHHSEWTAGLGTLFHRFGRVAFGWDAQHVRVIATLLGQGMDGVFSDHVDRMVDAVAAFDASAWVTRSSLASVAAL